MIFNVIYLIASWYPLAFKNGCILQAAHKIPEHVTIGSQELVWAVSGILPQITVSAYSLHAECGMAEISGHCSLFFFHVEWAYPGGYF